MSSENKELIRRVFEAFSKHDLDTMSSLVSEDLVHHGTTSQGREGFRAEAQYWIDAFPVMSSSIEELVAEGDKVVVRLRVTATNEGEFFGSPPTGRTVDVQEVHIARVEDGHIAEMWSAPDLYGLLSQLGMIPGAAEEEPV